MMNLPAFAAGGAQTLNLYDSVVFAPQLLV
jgi:hypothetical protein